MSDDQEHREAPPDFGHDDDANKNDDSMFVSVSVPETVDISLNGDDDDEDNPFGEPKVREKTSTNTTNTVESSVDNEAKSSAQEKPTPSASEDNKNFFQDLSDNKTSPFGDAPSAPSVVAKPRTPSPIPVKKEATPFSADLDDDVMTSPGQSSKTFESQIPSSKLMSSSLLSDITTEPKAPRKRVTDDKIHITVGDPTKIGEGMSSYVAYRITTRTTLPMFSKSEFSVQRRFSDFLGLHVKVVNKYLHVGILMPSPPEKDSISMAKVKISKEESIPTDFIDRRRALLERYLNRLARHPKLLEDADVREFIESAKDLPKSTNTQALSGAGVLRAFNTISNQVTKITTKKSEQDQWFEEKYTFVSELLKQFKNLYNQFNSVFSHRKEAGSLLKNFSATLNHLATAEEHPLLSNALTELANVQEKIEQVHSDQALKEYSLLTELVKEYLSLLEMVQSSFQERIKLHQQWLHNEEMLKKKQEAKAKLEQSPKGADKLPQAEADIREWESRVARSKEDFEHISATIKEEMDVFELTRLEDFQQAINDYLDDVLEQENKILQIWEAYMPEANKIN